MKKLFLLIILLFCSAVNFAQQQNNHWCFGNHAHLKFDAGTISQLPSEIMPSNNSYFGLEGCASVSDYNTGDLLLYSDGTTIFGANHQPIINGTGLMGSWSSSQNIVFLPKPGDRNHYFAFTSNGLTSDSVGLYFSEIAIDPCTKVASVLNNNSGMNITPLLDHLGNFTGNEFECITTAKHSNGIDYWVIAQVNDLVYSYLLTSNGVVNGTGAPNRPYSSFLMPTAVVHNPTGITADAGKLKISQTDISPNVVRIAKAVMYNGINSVRVGTFNRSTGTIVFNNNYPITSSAYSVEFSNNGNILYYTDGNNRIRRRNMATNTALADIVIPANSVNATYTFFELQLAVDNNIYVSNSRANLGRITNANLTTAAYSSNAVTLLTDAAHTTTTTSNIGLPQLVQQHPQDLLPAPVILVANNDVFSANSCSTTTSTAAVYANDTNNGVLITSPLTGLVITPLGLPSPTPIRGGITLNANGTITVLVGTPVGTYTLPYQICTPGSCPTCSNIGVITVNVTGGGNVLVAANDTFNYDECALMKMNVKYNNPSTSDSINGSPILTSTTGITVQQISNSLSPVPATGNITINTTGIVSVGPTTPPGTYTLRYKLLLNDSCGSQSNEATVTINIMPSEPFQPLTIGDDFICTTSGTTTIASIFDNDTIGGVTPTASDVSISLLGSVPGITVNPDGTITVAAGTPHMEQYIIPYTILQNCYSSNSPVPRKIHISVGLSTGADSITMDSNGVLLNGPINILTNDKYACDPVNGLVSITYSSNPYFTIDTILGSPSFGNITLTGVVPSPNAIIPYTICEVAIPGNCVNGSVSVHVQPSLRQNSSSNPKEKITVNSNLNIYPNPSSGIFNIQINNQDSKENDYKLTVLNPLGQTIIEKTVNQSNAQIDLSSFDNGTYFLKLQMGEEIINRIIIKK